MDSHLPARNATHSVAGGCGNDNLPAGRQVCVKKSELLRYILLLSKILPLFIKKPED